MFQPDLFTYSSISTRELLLCRAREGLLFYGIAQVAAMTGKTAFEVRYAIISTYHLDALRLGGEYRIPYTGILGYLDYLENKPGNYSETAEIKDYDPGRIALYMYLARLPHGHIPAGNKPYDKMPGKAESCPLDWYSLSELPLPFSETVSGWARILGVPADLVRSSIGSTAKMIRWPEIYDWLVECEVVNLPIPLENVDAPRTERMPSLFD
ncbi:MAG: hypothetical protein J5891_07620 [Spirochaetales bacterium]|nr:hypothetical protein [Spirochaetales bacterium]